MKSAHETGRGVCHDDKFGCAGYLDRFGGPESVETERRDSEQKWEFHFGPFREQRICYTRIGPPRYQLETDHDTDIYPSTTAGRREVEILNWISSAEFEKKTENKHIETSKGRHPSTGSWLLRTPQFQELTGENPPSPLLWGFGIRMSFDTPHSRAVTDQIVITVIAGAGKTFVRYVLSLLGIWL